MTRHLLTSISVLILGWGNSQLLCQSFGAHGSDQVSFANEVKPILAKKCFACHGPDDSEGGLSLDKRDSALAELDSGAMGIVPKQPDESEIIRRIEATDEYERMPPEGKPLSEEEVTVLRKWIEQGANYEKHWSFQPIQRAEPPTVKQADWVQNDIDQFVLARLEARGLEPAPPASKTVLARRLYYDLIGLPPTPDELAEFLADDREDAYERLVDKLLASPHYGEQWARHWLDVVRYAESNSYERDAPKPNVWKYRDYVIRSLNEDKPFDQFVREQLAGDELDEVTLETMTATGYYRLGIYQDEPDDPLQVKADEMDDIVSTTGQAFLGLTVGCARCHDHKIDPFPQKNYFGMVAFMADLTPFGERGDFSNSLWYTGPTENRRQREQLRRRIGKLRRSKYKIEQAGIARMDAPLQRLTETHEREEVLAEHLDGKLTEEERERYATVLKGIDGYTAELDELPEFEYVLAVAKTNPEPEPTHLHQRGNPHVPGDEITPHFPDILGGEVPEIPSPGEGKTSTGRRRVLADWIASPENPLSSRVIVNRLWQHHFGRGIVRTPNNFGQLGIPPTHPKLLDNLATFLIDNDWKLKALHRLIVTSNVYRMSSQANPDALAVDPNNDLFWRYDMRRLTAEQVRDSVLLASGQLNRNVYGPSFYPKLSDEVLQTQSRPGENWGDSSETERARRSVYIHTKRSLLVPLLTAFDAPDPDSSCEARFNTTQPAQAFALLHSSFLHEQAAKLAERVKTAVGSEDQRAQIDQVHRFVFGRAATEEEINEGVELMNRLHEQRDKDADEALRFYCLAAMNFSEFLYLD